jgi:hypothetical protein
MDVSGRILGTWMPAIHAGMTVFSEFCLRCVRSSQKTAPQASNAR